MGLSGKEIMLRAYRHEKTQILPDFREGVKMMAPLTGILERPFYTSGQDWFGVSWIFDEAAKAPVPDHTQPPVMEDISEWREKVVFPDLEAWDWEKARQLDKPDQYDRENYLIHLFITAGPFERLHFLMGFENALCALLTDPEEVEAFFDAFMVYKCRLIEKICEHYNPDIINFHDDWGTQSNMFFSPEIWRELIKPQIKKAVDKAHSLGKFFEMHSCGKMEQIIPEFVDIGIDSFQGMEINNVAEMKKLTKDKLLYIMAPDYQRYESLTVAGLMTEEELRREARASILASAEGGSFVTLPMPTDKWYLPVYMDEVKKCRELLNR